MTKENVIHDIEGQKIKDEDLTPEQRTHKHHIISLRNKITKLQFEIDQLSPSLKWWEDSLISLTKEQAKNVLSEDEASVEES